jgi:hypothetical protein
MHLNYQGVASAMFRAPLTPPFEVEFYAPAFVTTGHWWEFVLTPDMADAEHTGIPSQQRVLPPATLANGGGGFTPGPGTETPTASLNFIYAGANDIPCTTQFRARGAVVVHPSYGSGATTYANPKPSLNDLPRSTPAMGDSLLRVRVVVGVDFMWVRMMDRGGMEVFSERYPVRIGWPRVYAHLVGVAYQADHHPQDCPQGEMRELVWKGWRVVGQAGPNMQPQLVARAMSYDMRDTMRFGAGQPNPVPYTRYGMAGACFNVPGCTKPPRMSVVADPGDSDECYAVFDIRGIGVATLYVDGVALGAVRASQRLRGVLLDEFRRVALPVRPGATSPLSYDGWLVELLLGSGRVEVDRLEVVCLSP